jgi:AbrB family looped-hinge helix DNA binding protein
MVLARVLPRGQITIPQEIREAVHLGPGDTVQMKVTGPDTIQITVLPRLTLDEWLARYQLCEPSEITVDEARRLGEQDVADAFVANMERVRRESMEPPA